MLAYDYMKNRILVTKIDQTIFKGVIALFSLVIFNLRYHCNIY
jgi:hypothetical protein